MTEEAFAQRAARNTQCAVCGTDELRTAQCALALVVLNLVWRTVRYAVGFPLWGDEAFVAVNFQVRDFAEMIAPLEHAQIVPLGFMWAGLGVSRVLGTSEYAMRLLPYLAGLASMVLFWRFARRAVGSRAAFLGIAVFAAAYYPVRYAAEVKPYAWDLLVSLVLTSAAWSVVHRPRSRRGWAVLLAATAVAPWVSYPSLFVAGAVGLVLLYMVCRRQRPAPLAGLLVYGLGLAASAGAMLWLYALPHARAAPWLAAEPWMPPVGEPRRLPLWLIRIHAGKMLAYPMGSGDFSSTASLLLAVVGSAVLWRRRRLLLLLLLGPLPLTFIAAALKRYPYGGSAGVSLYMAPAFCLLIGLGAAAVLRACLPARRAAAGRFAAALLLAAIPLASIVRDLVRPYRMRPDRETRRVVRWLAGRTRQADQWVVFLSLAESSQAPSLLDRGGEAARCRFYLHRLAPVPVAWAPPPELIRPRPGGRTWLVVHRHDVYPFPEDLLASYMAALSQRLGRHRRYTFSLHRGEAMEIYEFPPVPTVGPVRRRAPRGSPSNGSLPRFILQEIARRAAADLQPRGGTGRQGGAAMTVAGRALRRMGIGRKNCLFCGSDDGGTTAAILFSLIGTWQRPPDGQPACLPRDVRHSTLDTRHSTLSISRLEFAVEAAVLDRLRQVFGLDVVTAGQVRDGPPSAEPIALYFPYSPHPAALGGLSL